MERIKHMSLKKSLFTIAFINSTAALFLSLLSFWGCMKLSSAIAPQGVILDVHANPVTMTEIPEPAADAVKIAKCISVFQILLPILFYTVSMAATVFLFYRLKLREPLKLLTEGASRIMNNDLDFRIEARSKDELGQLCGAFETMRKALFENNRKLWRQAEERKRLNAAFSHNLRNPVTVLKGSAKLAKQGVLNGTSKAEWISENLTLIENYTNRIERYIETMSGIQKLEEIPLVQEYADYSSISRELEQMVYFIGLDNEKQLHFTAAAYPEPILIDKSILFQIAENLVSNALRFAKRHIEVSCAVKEDVFELSVTDDGCGFPASLIQNGILPFQKGDGDTEHFGMGLYISKLLAGRHGGAVCIRNDRMGAAVLATLKIKNV